MRWMTRSRNVNKATTRIQIIRFFFEGMSMIDDEAIACSVSRALFSSPSQKEFLPKTKNVMSLEVEIDAQKQTENKNLVEEVKEPEK